MRQSLKNLSKVCESAIKLHYENIETVIFDEQGEPSLEVFWKDGTHDRIVFREA